MLRRDFHITAKESRGRWRYLTEGRQRHYNDLTYELRTAEDKLIDDNKLFRLLKQYFETKPIHQEYVKRGYPKRFRRINESQLILYQDAVKQIKDWTEAPRPYCHCHPYYGCPLHRTAGICCSHAAGMCQKPDFAAVETT